MSGRTGTSWDGNRVPGATTVGHVYPKGEGLIRWLIEQGIAEYDAKTALEKGGDIGTILHDYAERYELGRQGFDWHAVDTSPHKEEIKRVLERFVEWRRGNKDTVLMMEELCALPALHVAGRIDTLREREGLGLVLSDYKTTKSIYVTHLLQVVGGYRPMMSIGTIWRYRMSKSSNSRSKPTRKQKHCFSTRAVSGGTTVRVLNCRVCLMHLRRNFPGITERIDSKKTSRTFFSRHSKK
jgi:hypothetical protein